ncbi:MAG TPA: PDZ domain-containing protein [Pyrinomonadaceae bacterium]|nr:PDZ domain-containing protein [Pyrinomonadaceae bacterium]
MRLRNLLLTLSVLLWAGGSAPAQTPPSAPSQPAPPAAVVAPAEPMSFSFFLDGGTFLGVQPEDINRENMSRYGLSRPRGVGVGNVSKDSPAERAGLKKGDVILQLDDEPVTSTRKLLRLIGEAAPEQTVRLTISRNGSEQQLTATLGKREAVGAGAYNLMTPPEPGEFQLEVPPSAPRAPRGWEGREWPEVFSYGFGNNRRVGVTTTPLTRQLADYMGVSSGKGLLVTSVAENTPASRAGLRAGDVITEVNGAAVEDTGDFIRELNRKDEGEVTLTVVRDKSHKTIKVTPERKAAPAINLTEFPTAPMARLRIAPRIQVESVYRALQAMPRVENLVLPKMNKLVTPRVMKLPRVVSLPAMTDFY